MRRLHLAVPLLLLLCTAMPARLAAATPEEVLSGLFADGVPAADRFTPAFRNALPPGEVARVLSGLRRDLGALRGVEAAESGHRLRFDRAEVPARIVLDGEGRIAGLWFGAPVATGTLEAHVAAIAALPGRSAVLVLSDGATVAAHAADTPLAVGSAAKLAVLLAVKEAVAAGTLGWDQVVRLDPAARSLPSGMLQGWPAGTPLTVATLAHLMIAISDNTATDALVALVGRGAVEAKTPRNAPYVTTREAFVPKDAGAADLRARWRAGDTAARRAILAEIAGRPLPAPDGLETAVTVEVEWYVSARELCALLDATADLPSVAINAGPVPPGPWQAVAYKGGSEIGVLSLASRVVGADGRAHCVVATWNDDGPLDDTRLLGPYRGLLGRLAAAE